MTFPVLTGTHLRTALVHVPTSIATLGPLVDGQPDGMVIGSFVDISLDPPLVEVAIQDTSSTWPRSHTADAVGISVLAENHAHLIRQLADPKERRFDRAGWFVGGDAMHPDHYCTQLTTHIIEKTPLGDHILVVLKASDATEPSTTHPLVSHGLQVITVASTSH